MGTAQVAPARDTSTEALWAAVNRPLSDFRDHRGYPNWRKAWRIDVCKDGTFSIQRRGAKSINDGHALPAYSTDTFKEAIRLRLILCFSVRAKHPDLPAGEWYKLNDVTKTGGSSNGLPVFLYDDHKAVAWKIAGVAEILEARR